MPDTSRVANEAVLVIPCYNEAKRLPRESIRDFLAAQPSVNLLFVNDGSRDATLTVLQALRNECEQRITILDLAVNCGKAEAVRRGLEQALAIRPRYVGFWDADMATPLPAALAFIDVLKAHPGIHWVIGARVKLLGRHVERKAIRHYLGRIFASAVSVTLRMAVYDTQCGAKLFRATDELAALLREPFLARWIFDVEMMARLIQGRAHAAGAPADTVIYEYPLMQWKDVEGSKLRGTDFLRAAGDLWRIHRAYLSALPDSD